jgi:hypothetical protein
MGGRRHAAAGLAAALFALAGTTDAAPPEGPLRHKEWFEGLRQPGTQAQCCSIADCRVKPYRMTADGYEVQLDDRWVRVPPEKILQRIDNPTGGAVVCYTPPEHIMCFVRATEG